ncbi:hypothetical protein NM688_g3934 [Phlebia brevispora]|uniref:Uncharacterized protein n=1 Tax=Phlebia brevispora TaxID=194682 RepID=A0ACC1T462_9APHY|nr:hypothetical protein NM688_g3934 [Phlebia brevispora]
MTSLPKVPQTPRKSTRNGTAIPTTPARRQAIHENGTDRKLDDARAANLTDLGEDVRQFDVATFFSYYLPPIRDGIEVEKLVQYLTKDGTITPDGWEGFSEPKVSTDKEDTCYAPVEKIVNAIVEAAKSLGYEGTTGKCKCDPRKKPKASFRESSCLPDCVLYFPTRGRKGPHWDDIAVTGEFKKDHSNVDRLNDNIEQLVWNLNQTMRNDPCRRFTLGFTIENTVMRIWHCDRSEVVVSKSFDFNKNNDQVVEFFLRTMFAEPVDLGWDPTIQRVRVNKEYRFRITVQLEDGQKRFFETISQLSTEKADALRGRGTRVWKSTEVTRTGRRMNKPPVVLKDTWIDDDRQREGYIIEQIRNVENEEHRVTLQEMLLTVECHGDVLIHDQHDTTRRAPDDASDERFLLEQPRPNAQELKVKADQIRATNGSAYRSPDRRPKAIPSYHKKTHYRIVFKEVGKTLQSEKSLVQVYDSLSQVAHGLHALHASGWVHRDISSTNILIVGDQTKLTDFEYAKKIGDTTVHNVRSGTYFYHAVEIDYHEYMFRPVTSRQGEESTPKDTATRPGGLSAFMAQTELLRNRNSSGQSKATTAKGTEFVYQPAHDVESTWWNGVDFAINREIVSVGGQDPEPRTEQQRDEQERFAAALFHTLSGRDLALRAEGNFMKNAQCLHPSLAICVQELEEIRDELVLTYTKAEKDVATADFFNASQCLYSRAQFAFLTIAKHFATTQNVWVRHIGSTEVIAVKRSRPDDAEDEETDYLKKARHD